MLQNLIIKMQYKHLDILLRRIKIVNQFFYLCISLIFLRYRTSLDINKNFIYLLNR